MALHMKRIIGLQGRCASGPLVDPLSLCLIISVNCDDMQGYLPNKILQNNIVQKEGR